MPAAMILWVGKRRDVVAVEHDAAGARRRQPEDRADQRGLAGAVGAEQAGDAAGLDGERDALQHVGLVVGGEDALDFEQLAIMPPRDRLPAPARSAATARYGPSAILRPKLSTTQRSVMRSITPISCSTMTMVRFLLRSRTSRMSSISSLVSSCVMPADGSSSSSSFGCADQRAANLDAAAVDHRQAGDRLEHAVGKLPARTPRPARGRRDSSPRIRA